MVGISENSLRAEVTHLLHSESFDCRSGGGADEGWSLNISMRSMNNADSG